MGLILLPEASETTVMRILMLNIEYPPLGGGAANATYHLLRELARDKSIAVDLITSSARNSDDVERIGDAIRLFKLDVGKAEAHFWRAGELLRWTLRAFGMARRLLRRERYDLCHCWFGWPAGVIGYCLRGRLPYLVALRGSDVPGYNQRLRRLDPWLFRPLSAVVWRHAHAVTSTSHTLANLARRVAGDLTVQVIYNGVDLGRFTPGRRSAADGCGLRLLFVGRLIKRKGVICLLEAFARVLATDPRCRLTIAGDGPQKVSLQAFCWTAGMTDRVCFLEAVEPGRIARVYHEADVLVMPSIDESLCNVVLEAMASGLPVITTRTGAAEPIDGNGLVVPPGDSRQLAAAILRYVGDARLRADHARRSRAIAAGLSWAQTARAYRGIYHRLAIAAEASGGARHP